MVSPLNSGIILPKVSLSTLDNSQLTSQEFFIGFDLDNFGKLAKLDQNGIVTLLEGGSLEQLSDVSISSPGPQTGDVLQYNGTAWEPAQLTQSYEYAAYYSVSGTTLSLDRVVNNTLTDYDPTFTIFSIRNGVGQYNFTIIGSGNILNNVIGFVQLANASPGPNSLVFPNWTGGDTYIATMFKDDAGVGVEINGSFLLVIRIY